MRALSKIVCNKRTIEAGTLIKPTDLTDEELEFLGGMDGVIDFKPEPKAKPKAKPKALTKAQKAKLAKDDAEVEKEKAE